MFNTYKASELSSGQMNEDQWQLYFHVLGLIQKIILAAVPVLCILVLAAALASQIVRLLFAGYFSFKIRFFRKNGAEEKCLLTVPDSTQQ